MPPLLTITQRQLEVLSKDRAQDFAPQAVAHLREHHPEWCATRDDAALARHVATAMDFAREYGVSREANVLWLMDLQLRPGFTLPLPDYPRYRLTQRGFDEDTRVRNFALALTRPQRPIVITLETDLEALEAGNA